MSFDPEPNQIVRDAYGLEGVSLRLVNESENRTWFVERGGAPLYVLRRYREGHRSPREVEAELSWMGALRASRVVEVPAVIPTAGGALMVGDAQGAIHALFEYVPGAEPPESELVRWFAALGRICARLHLHSSRWALPAGSSRPRLDYDSLIGARPVWGPIRLS
jgi:Ser/Thr protein kinase RdoA (MazF antagonist)